MARNIARAVVAAQIMHSSEAQQKVVAGFYDTFLHRRQLQLDRPRFPRYWNSFRFKSGELDFEETVSAVLLKRKPALLVGKGVRRLRSI